jgi:superfamily II DNA/RNA helicase
LSSVICDLSFFNEVKAAMVNLIIPDKWQQDAVKFLREGFDVVVQAPTGSGKTYIFELIYDSLKGQAIYTVPTRALANDKLAEWRQRGWDVGIATGDLAENLNAKVVVATLETQKARFLRREGPRLLVIDEYQLLADPVRGTNYELILSLAPPETQLLLLSGSVANPPEIVDWLRRNGRRVELVEHRQRPVPLEEVMLSDLPARAPANARGYWPKLISRALISDLGPILVFAPRRQGAEDLAISLASALPAEEPLVLTPEQSVLAGEPLARLLRSRVAFHHSGLSYAVRAGIIEPLAKKGQLRVVVATMGLAAGINFSMRSVLVTGTHYQAGNFQRHVRADELLQMFGRAGRRGLDEIGYALVTPEIPRLHEAFPSRLRRADPIDWPSMIAVMQEAARRGEDPFRAVTEVATHLFSTRPLLIGVEKFYERTERSGAGAVANEESILVCGFPVDAERGRLVRRHEAEMLNSRGEWELCPPMSDTVLSHLWIRKDNGRWRPALTLATTLQPLGFGNLCKIRWDKNRFEYGRELPVASVTDKGWLAAKWFRKVLREHYPLIPANRTLAPEKFLSDLVPLIAKEVKGEFHDFVLRKNTAYGRFRFGGASARGHLDDQERYLANPEIRRSYPLACQRCACRSECEALDVSASPAFAWRQLGLIDERGVPTRRGIIFSFFNQGEGLAIAAGLEEADYPINDLVFDLADLRAGHRFAMDDSRAGGRLAAICQNRYHRASFSGYLELGLPIAYGSGASEVVRDLVEHQIGRHKLVNDNIRHGDIERALTEWRSLLRQIVQAPDCQWERWKQLQEIASVYVLTTQSPARQPLPALAPNQMSYKKWQIADSR